MSNGQTGMAHGVDQFNFCEKHPEGGINHWYRFCSCDIASRDECIKQLEAELATRKGCDHLDKPYKRLLEEKAALSAALESEQSFCQSERNRFAQENAALREKFEALKYLQDISVSTYDKMVAELAAAQKEIEQYRKDLDTERGNHNKTQREADEANLALGVAQEAAEELWKMYCAAMRWNPTTEKPEKIKKRLTSTISISISQ